MQLTMANRVAIATSQTTGGRRDDVEPVPSYVVTTASPSSVCLSGTPTSMATLDAIIRGTPPLATQPHSLPHATPRCLSVGQEQHNRSGLWHQERRDRRQAPEGCGSESFTHQPLPCYTTESAMDGGGLLDRVQLYTAYSAFADYALQQCREGQDEVHHTRFRCRGPTSLLGGGRAPGSTMARLERYVEPPILRLQKSRSQAALSAAAALCAAEQHCYFMVA